MRHWMIGAALLLAGCAPATITPATAQASSGEQVAVERAVDAVYARYLKPGEEPLPADWNMKIWSGSMTGRIARWQKAIGDQLTGMNSAGWFCGCQDWDPKTAKIRSRIVTRRADGSYDAVVTFSPMTSEPGHEDTLHMVREKGRWLIQEMVFGENDLKLSTQLDEEIAAKGPVPL